MSNEVELPDSPPSPRGLTAETALATAAASFVDAKQKPGGGGRYASDSRVVLEGWVEWTEQRDAHTLADVDADLMHSYVDYLRARVDARVSNDTPSDAGVAGSTARQYYARVRAFLSWCVGHELIATNPAKKESVVDDLPAADDGRGDPNQQFWTPDFRKQFLRWTDWRFETAADQGWMDPDVAARDRALVAVLAYSGARGAEILREPRDARRNGLQWGDVDLDRDEAQLTVRGKNQKREEVGLLEQGADRLRTHWRRSLRPPDEWPVFPSGHLPSLYEAAREAADGDVGSDLGPGTVTDIIRRAGGTPPSLTVSGGGTILERLSVESGLRIDGDVAKPHGARRGLGDELYLANPATAQDQLRHQSVETTHKSYRDRQTDRTTRDAQDIIDGS